jgi:hypothetical protein
MLVLFPSAHEKLNISECTLLGHSSSRSASCQILARGRSAKRYCEVILIACDGDSAIKGTSL